MKPKKTKRYIKKDLREFKDILVKMKAGLIDQIAAVEKETLSKSQRDASGDLSSYSIHMADLATDSYDREFSLDRVSAGRKVLYEIEDALKSMQEDKYGICASCGNLISKKRLKAVPYAKLCIECQSLEERGKKSNR